MHDLQRFFPFARFGAIKAATPVTVGLSNASVWAVSTDAGEFFLRRHAADLRGFVEAVAAQRLAAREGLAPDVFHVDDLAGVAVSAKVEGVHIGQALRQPNIRPLALRRVAECLARLHAIPASGFPIFDPSVCQSIWDEQSQRTGFPDWAKAFGSFIRIGKAIIAEDARQVFSHNDVHFLNLLWDGSQVWMVDWARAGMSHPYLDLATFSNFANLPDQEGIGLLALQEQSSLSDEQQLAFHSIRNLARVVYGALFLRLVPDLAEIHILPRDKTPTLRECYLRFAAGGLDPKTPIGQAMLAGAMLRQVPI